MPPFVTHAQVPSTESSPQVTTQVEPPPNQVKISLEGLIRRNSFGRTQAWESHIFYDGVYGGIGYRRSRAAKFDNAKESLANDMHKRHMCP